MLCYPGCSHILQWLWQMAVLSSALQYTSTYLRSPTVSHFSFCFPRLNKPASFSLPSKVRFSRPLSLLVSSPLDPLQLMCILKPGVQSQTQNSIHGLTNPEGNRRLHSHVLQMTSLRMCTSGHGFPGEGLKAAALALDQPA